MGPHLARAVVVVAWLWPLTVYAQAVADDVRIAPNSRIFVSPNVRGFDGDLTVALVVVRERSAADFEVNGRVSTTKGTSLLVITMSRPR